MSKGEPKGGMVKKGLGSTAMIGLVGTIGAAIISAAVSHEVSKLTTGTEIAKIRSTESIEKSKLFNELMGDLNSDDNSFALIALWKMYPDDHRLILVSALQNPTRDKMTTLRAIAPDGELDRYASSIESLMLFAESKDRREFANLFVDISPETVFRIYIKLLDQAINIGPFEHSQITGELITLLKDRTALHPVLDRVIQKSYQYADNSHVEASASLALLNAGYRPAWARFLSKLQERENMQFNFLHGSTRHQEIIARLLDDNSEGRAQLVTVIVDTLNDVCDRTSERYRTVCIEGTEYFDKLNDRTDPSYNDAISDILQNHIKRNPGYLHLALFKVLYDYDAVVGKDVFEYILACSDKAQDFYSLNKFSISELPDLDSSTDFNIAVSAAKGKYNENACSSA